jgi:hypothetical protein
LTELRERVAERLYEMAALIERVGHWEGDPPDLTRSVAWDELAEHPHPRAQEVRRVMLARADVVIELVDEDRRGPGSPEARMRATWAAIEERWAALWELVGYSPSESKRTSERALVEAFDKMLRERDRA